MTATNGRTSGSSRRNTGRSIRLCLASLALLLAITAGCGDNRDQAGGDADNGTNGTNSQQNQTDNHNHAGAGQSDHTDGMPESPPEDEMDTALDEQFVSLAETGAPVSDLLTFIRTFGNQASRAELTDMLLIFEEKQLEQGYAVEDRFYENGDVQEALFDWYVKHQRLPRAKDLDDGPTKRFLEEVEASGYKVETAEGVFFPVIDYDLYKQFRDRVTEDIRAYIDLMVRESSEPAVKDAALIIPWEEVVRRALAFEAFVAQYPDSARAETADRLKKDYVYISFRGIDNSPLFETEGGPVVHPVLESYKKAIKENGTSDSPYLSDLREFVRLVEIGGGKQTAEVRDFQEKVTEGLLEEYDDRYSGVDE